MPIIKNMINNTIYIVQELHIFHNHLQFYYKSFHFHQYFHYTLQLVYQLVFSYIYDFHNVNILQHNMIYYIHIHNHLDSKQILYHKFLCQLIICIHICIYLYSNVAYYSKHLYLVYIYIYKFHPILYVLFHYFLASD